MDDREGAIELDGEGLEGESLSVEQLRGKPVVLNVWAHWCGPCEREQPHLNEVAAELGDRAAFLGINIRESSVENPRAYVRSLDVPYPSIYSPDGRALLSFDGTLTTQSLPATVVLDGEGRIAAIIRGAVPTPVTLLDTVEKVLDE